MSQNSEPQPDEDPEIAAMKQIGAALAKLKDENGGRARVLRWAVGKYGSKPSQSPVRTQGQAFLSLDVDTETASEPRTWQDFPTMFNAADPQTDPERALVAGYWFQVVKASDDLHGQQLNDELKHMGHGIGNITDALSSLMERRPQLVMQTRKSGTARQARKKYKLTTEGVRFVEQMLARSSTADSPQ